VAKPASPTPITLKSPLRYPGGKSKALAQILPLIPDSIRELREPFVGGGSVFLAVCQRSPYSLERLWINDLNYDLCCFWRMVRDELLPLVEEITRMKSRFEQGRDLFAYLTQERSWTDFERAVRFFILNRITFSGTVEAGGYSQQAFERRFTLSSIERLQALQGVLTHVEITCGDYAACVNAPGEEVFLFLDPPYYRAMPSRLYGIRGELHTGFDHRRFAATMRHCSHRWLITYDDSPAIRDLFGFAHIQEWQLQYGMNNFRQTTAAMGREVFIRNY